MRTNNMFSWRNKKNISDALYLSVRSFQLAECLVPQIADHKVQDLNPIESGFPLVTVWHSFTQSFSLSLFWAQLFKANDIFS